MHLVYTHGTHIGYARYGTELAAAIRRAGVTFRETLGPGDIPEHAAVWVNTPNHVKGWFDGQHKVLCTMWETDRLPEEFRQGFGNFDRIIVPSEHNRELFGRYHPDVVKVPLGVNGDIWRYRERLPPDRRFVFLCAGNGPRKGIDVAVAAFKKVFGTGGHQPLPILMVKSPRPLEGAIGERIQNVTGWLSDAEEVDLYAQAHCFLGLSRGEGFGMMPLQAIAQGCPTILTRAHGHLEFSALGLPVQARKTRADPSLYGDNGDWWEPDLDSVCHAMEGAYIDYPRVAGEAAFNAGLAHDLFSWERCAVATLDAVGKEHLEAAYTGRGEWCEPRFVRYPVRVSQFWTCQVGGVDYQFSPGVTYWESGEIKRILYEGNLLDPGCVDPDGDTGLTEEQLARFGDYSAAQSYCHHCGQKLGTGVRYQPEAAR